MTRSRFISDRALECSQCEDVAGFLVTTIYSHCEQGIQIKLITAIYFKGKFSKLWKGFYAYIVFPQMEGKIILTDLALKITQEEVNVLFQGLSVLRRLLSPHETRKQNTEPRMVPENSHQGNDHLASCAGWMNCLFCLISVQFHSSAFANDSKQKKTL